MKKTVLIGGAALLAAGFFTLTAFGGKTKAQQDADIAKAVTEQVDAFRQEKIAECDERVAAAAQAKYDELMAAAPAEPAKPAPGKKTAPKGKGGPKVDPLPQPAPPKPSTATQAKDDKMNRAPNTEAKDDKMNQKPNTSAKDAKMNKLKNKEGGN